MHGITENANLLICKELTTDSETLRHGRQNKSNNLIMHEISTEIDQL